MGWRGMKEALAKLDAADVDGAVEVALTAAAAESVPEIAAAWPVDTGASGTAWRAEGTTVRNDRPEVTHIRAGAALAVVPPILESQQDVVERELAEALGLD